MASFNCAPYIEQAVRSVLAQSFADWELIISDDASTDNTPSLLSTISTLDQRIRVISSPVNQGAARARNAALAVAEGRYIAFLDSDDLWKPHKLERQVSFMKDNHIAFSFSSYERIDEAGAPMGLVRVSEPVNYRKLLAGNVVGCLTAVYDTALTGKVEMPEIAKRQDYGLWLRLLKKVNYAVPLTESLGYYRQRRSSVSANKADAARYTWLLLRNVERLPLPAAMFYFTSYAMRGLWSHYGPRK